MTILSSIEGAAAALGGAVASIDFGKIEQIIGAIVNAAPAIVEGEQTVAPFVEAIVELIQKGGAPTDDEWAALQARLQANTVALDTAAAQPDQAETSDASQTENSNGGN